MTAVLGAVMLSRPALLLVLLGTGAAATKPNIVFVLVDDLGWNGVGFHNPAVQTPTIDALATSGLKIDGFYTYKVCAPARASFLTGRFPFHLAATKTNFAYFWTLEGTNLAYTMFPEKLQAAGSDDASLLRQDIHRTCAPDFD